MVVARGTPGERGGKRLTDRLDVVHSLVHGLHHEGLEVLEADTKVAAVLFHPVGDALVVSDRPIGRVDLAYQSHAIHGK